MAYSISGSQLAANKAKYPQSAPDKAAKKGTEVAPKSQGPKAGSGKFQALKSKLAKEKGVTNPGALAASIGRKKFGEAAMARASAQGRKRA